AQAGGWLRHASPGPCCPWNRWESQGPNDHVTGALSAGKRRDHLVLLDLRVERRVVDHMLAVDELGDAAALLTRLLQNALGLFDRAAGFLGIGSGVVFDHLMAMTVSDDDSCHESPPHQTAPCASTSHPPPRAGNTAYPRRRPAPCQLL